MAPLSKNMNSMVPKILGLNGFRGAVAKSTISTKEDPRLSATLTQSQNFKDEVFQSKFEGLSFVTSGSIVPNPSELLASKRFSEFLDWAKNEYEYVIVDSPPVLGLADAPILGALVDASLLIVQTGKIKVKSIISSIERLSGSGTKILGVVLTQYNSKSQGYGDYYQYAYGQAASQYGEAQSIRKSKSNKNALNKKERLDLS